jgi:hypothetical protein
LGLVIDKFLLRRVGWDIGTEIELQADAGQKIIVLSARTSRHCAARGPRDGVRGLTPTAR